MGNRLLPGDLRTVLVEHADGTSAYSERGRSGSAPPARSGAPRARSLGHWSVDRGRIAGRCPGFVWTDDGGVPEHGPGGRWDGPRRSRGSRGASQETFGEPFVAPVRAVFVESNLGSSMPVGSRPTYRVGRKRRRSRRPARTSAPTGLFPPSGRPVRPRPRAGQGLPRCPYPSMEAGRGGPEGVRGPLIITVTLK